MTTIADQVQLIKRSGVFDRDFYIRSGGFDAASIADPVLHYCEIGDRQGHSPNVVFDTFWYRNQHMRPGHGDTALYHYMTEGDRSDHAPSPLFDTRWYRQKFLSKSTNINALSHYIANRTSALTSPNEYFDTSFYLKTYPDIAQAPVEPFEHFIRFGVFEGRRPSAQFDPRYVANRYLHNDRSKNPFLIFMQLHRALGWRGVPDPVQATIAREVRKNTSKSTLFEERPALFASLGQVKALAFYLPQFHAIAENDRWWGTGFTEWTNLPRGLPRFKDHYQPRVPRDLGFYHLKDTDVLARQVALARNAGLYGFCFYYYNFDGHRLLEKPLDAFVADDGVDFPFCLLWANENWTRRWDGHAEDILIRQDYGVQSASALVADLAGYMRDRRYIRFKNRPLLFIYRADVIPDCRETLLLWRHLFKTEHELDPFIIMAQAFNNNDPRPFGFDAAMEFPPHKFGSIVPDVTSQVELLDMDFSGSVRSFDDVANASLNDFPADYPLVKTVFPGWDNDARKQGSGMVIQGSTPAKFQAWVQRLASHPRLSTILGERLICVNAWNEWCEGAYLEPDLHYGYAYLNAFSRGLAMSSGAARRRIVLVGHDAFKAGSQQLLYNIGVTLKGRFGFDVAFVLAQGGTMVESYREIGPTFVAGAEPDFWLAVVGHLKQLREAGFETAITNTVFSGSLAAPLSHLGFRTCSLIHELTTVVTGRDGEAHLKVIWQDSHQVVFPAHAVRRQLTDRFGQPAGATHLLPQGVYKHIDDFDPAQDRRLRETLDIPPNARIVLNAGFADLRKGVDRFVAIAQAVALLSDDIVFVWVGDADPAVDTWLLDQAQGGGSGNMRWVRFSDDIGAFMNAAELFLLSSREDPFPSVVLEALSAGTPVAGFRDAGGFADLLRDPGLGFLFANANLNDAARTVVDHVNRGNLKTPEAADYRRRQMKTHFDFGLYCSNLVNLLAPVARVSVVVPNYNYARHLEARLASIANQTHPIFELIVLDDGSSDGSADEVGRVAEMLSRDVILIENSRNSGNVFAQWAKGVNAATGDLVWIAEADDRAQPGFLDGLVPFFQRRDVGIAFSDSSAIDGDGALLWDSHKGYYETLFPGALSEAAVFEGADFVETFLSVKNVMVNVSAVLWRRDVLKAALEHCANALRHLKLAGDWLIYLEACRIGSVGYNPQPLNIHRRHGAGVTQSLDKQDHLREIAGIHRFLREQWRLAGRTEVQAAYLAELERQFDLAPPRPRAAPT